MSRIMTLRYASKCRVCNAHMPAGSRGIWLGKKNGVRHETCGNVQVSTVPANEPSPDSISVDFTSVRDLWHTAVNRKSLPLSAGNTRELERIVEDNWIGDSGWTGCTISEMREWLERGYTVEGLQGMESLIVANPRRRLNFREEGDELLIDLAWSGVDEHFSEWEKRISKPAISVEIDCSYSAKNPFSAIQPYLLWVARMLQSLDELGLDTEVKLTNTVTNAYVGQSGQVSTYVKVKSFGQASDIAAWSAMFSPGGFRMLTFTAKVLAANDAGKVIESHLGYPVNPSGYDLQYDSESNVLRVKQPNGGSFPEFDMTQKLSALLNQLSGK